MSNTVEAVYENGIFRPLSPVKLPEHQRVTIQLPDAASNITGEHDLGDTPATARTSEDPALQAQWTEEKNARRCDLIDKEIEGTITAVEQTELEALQRQAIAYRDRIAPLPLEGALKLHQELLRKKRATEK